MANTETTNDENLSPGLWARPRTRVILGAVLFFALYTIAWLGTAVLLQRGVTQWLQLQRDNGLSIAMSPLHMGGFPGPVRIAARDVVVAAPVVNGGWTWRAPKIRVKTWPLNFGNLTVDLSGSNDINATMVPPGLSLHLNAEATTLKLHLESGGRLRVATLSTTNLSAALGIAESPGQSIASSVVHLDKGTVRATLLDPPAPTPDTPSPTLPSTAQFAIDLGGLSLPSSFPPPLNQPITRAAATVEITGNIMPGLLPQVLETWRAAGGTLEIRNAALDWPPLHMSGDGTAALDEHLQPLGAFTLHFQGGGETLDALAKGGWMANGEAGIAKLGLSLMSKPGADGVTPEITLPLTLQDRQLSTGPVTVMTVPEVTWVKVVVP